MRVAEWALGTAAGLAVLAGALALRPPQPPRPLPAFVEDGLGGALVAAPLTAGCCVPEASAVAAAARQVPVPPHATVTAALYRGTATHRTYWVVTYGHITIPAMPMPNVPERQPWVWRATYILLDARTGEVTAIADQGA
jgi:hypothetical protein